tara:strand:+ start:1231 stop:2016 length:786 start_codon:yes stop_codon:yes gene_type:complete
MRIATWNVNGLRARIEFLTIWLKDRAPDIVGLQEIKVTDDQFPFEELEALGYHAVINGQKGWNGVAILSREPAEVIETELPGHDAMGSRLLTARVAGLDFTTVYCPNGKTLTHEDYPAKLEWLAALAELFEGRSDGDLQTVLCGDFNVCPEPLDSWRGEAADGAIFHTVEERQRTDAIRNSGLIDTYRDLYPDEQTFSWWDYRGGAFHRGHGLRIDHVYVSPAVRARAVRAQHDRDYRKKKDGFTASDHAPVIVDLDTAHD